MVSRLILLSAGLLALSLSAGCSTTAPVPVASPRAVWCEQNEPTRLPESVIDAMDRRGLDRMNVHNAKGEAWCGWTP